MALPVKALPRGKVTIEGTDVEVRGLSRAEALKLTTDFKDNFDGAETFLIAAGTGVSEEEAQAFRSNTDPATAGILIDKIIALSGLSDGEKDPK